MTQQGGAWRECAICEEAKQVRYCYRSFGKNDRTCYRDKGHTGRHMGMKAAVRERLQALTPQPGAAVEEGGV